MTEQGGIIYVVGLYGAGKTTLVKAALDEVAGLHVLPTLITRPPRPGELEMGYEYEFVSKDEYNRRREMSSNWDHTEVRGNYYGTDAGEINQQIKGGAWFIVSGPPAVEQLHEMESLYVGQRYVIWIDVSAEACNDRIRRRDGERANDRLNDLAESVQAKQAFLDDEARLFATSGDLKNDKAAFADLIRSLL